MTEPLVMLAGGQRYAGWTDLSFGRGLDRCASNFEIAVTERWLGSGSVPPILPFTPVQIFVGGDLALTGYSDDYNPGIEARRHTVRVTGRSRTAQLVDCSPPIAAGQFKGQTVAAIARAVAATLSIGVVVQTPLADAVVPDATVQPCDRAWDFLDRLFAVAGVIGIDDAAGNLLVTTGGAQRSDTHLQQGVNILKAEATISGADRYSAYTVMGQAGLSAGSGAVQTNQAATVTDPSVPIYRPRVWMAESPTAQASLQTQAQWQMNYAIGRSASAEVTVKGYRQDDGTLWAPDLVATLTAPALGVDDDLLITDVRFSKSARDGDVTVLTLQPPQAADPNPKALRLRKHGHRGRGKGRTIANWGGAGGY